MDFFNLQRSQALHTLLRALSSAEDVEEPLGGEAIISIAKCDLFLLSADTLVQTLVAGVAVEYIVGVVGS